MWLFILRNKWVQYALLAVALLAVAAGVRSYYIHQGVERGKESQKQEEEKTIQLQHEAERTKLQAEIAQNGAQAAQAHADSAKAEALAAGYAVEGVKLRGQLETGRQNVAALGDSQLHAYIVQQLGLRPANDTSAGYYPIEERRIAGDVTEAPKLRSLTDSQTKEIATLTEAVSKNHDEVAAVRTENKLRTDYQFKLEGWFTELYNLHPPKARKPKCLWLWKCGVNPLPVPSPDEVKKQAPK